MPSNGEGEEGKKRNRGMESTYRRETERRNWRHRGTKQMEIINYRVQRRARDWSEWCCQWQAHEIDFWSSPCKGELCTVTEMQRALGDEVLLLSAGVFHCCTNRCSLNAAASTQEDWQAWLKRTKAKWNAVKRVHIIPSRKDNRTIWPHTREVVLLQMC